MKQLCAVLVVPILLISSVNVQANVFDLGDGLTNLKTVRVGDAGNQADTTGFGSVNYTYNIGKYEVTTAQYCDFLNAKAKTDTYGLYNPSMDSINDNTGCGIIRSGDSGSYIYSVAPNRNNRPVNFVDYWSSCRFANWLSNDQGNGDTETGAYTLTATGIANNSITRNTGAKWAVASEDEWYKAAYYKGGTVNSGYWLYPTQSNTTPSNAVLSIDPGNSVNYHANLTFSIDSPYYRTNVGEFENSGSAYGTFDQGGNVWEYNDSIVDGANRCARGGSFINSELYLQSSCRQNGIVPTTATMAIGFRVVQLEAVPEPSSILALLCGVGGLSEMMWRRRKHN